MWTCSACGGHEFRAYYVEAIRSFYEWDEEGKLTYRESGRDGDGGINQVTCEECDADLSHDEIIAFCAMVDMEPLYDNEGPGSIGARPEKVDGI